MFSAGRIAPFGMIRTMPLSPLPPLRDAGSPAPSQPFSAGASATDAPGDSICQATAEQLAMFRSLLAECLRSSEQTSRHISQRLSGFPLLNASLLQAEAYVARVDHAAALVGEQWLSGFALLHALASHFQSHLPRGVAEEQSLVQQIWRDTLYLANSGELLARVSGRSPSLHGWLCGLLMGTAKINSAIRQFAKPSPKGRRHVLRGGLALRDVARLLAALQAGEPLRLPKPTSRPLGPWGALSTAQTLTPVTVRVCWATSPLARILPVEWPEAVTDRIVSKLQESRSLSDDFADHCWQQAAG